MPFAELPYSLREAIYMLIPEKFFYLLSDETRLRCLLLLQTESECCVCDFTYALQKNQPKISRHLSILKAANVVLDRRDGAWSYYSLHPDLPAWASRILSVIFQETAKRYSSDLIRAHERNRAACIKTSQPQENTQKSDRL